LTEALGDGLVPVISKERLSGSPHSGGYDSKSIADRLAAVFDAARVLICVREQRSIIASTFKQYVRAGGPLPLARYLHPPRAGSRKLPMFRFDHFEYDRLVAHYMRLFGSEHVLVIPYELLVLDAESFMASILEFAGARAPKGALQALPYSVRRKQALSGVGTSALRQLNRFIRPSRLNPAPLFPLTNAEELTSRVSASIAAGTPDRLERILDRRLRQAIEAEVGDRYRDSNRRLRELTGLTLEQLGYPL